MTTVYDSLTGTSLAAVTATGAGTIFNNGAPRTAASMQVSVTGAPSTWNVNLEGSVDGTNFFTLASVTQATTGSVASSINVHAMVAVRANLTAFSGGTSPTFTAVVAVA
jgi:hypothetical protein